MPSLGADMEAGLLVEWHKQPGDAVKRGDLIAEVETDKGIIEVESFVTGVLERILIEPGTRVPVGTPMAVIREEDGAEALFGSPPSAPAAAERARVSPAARQLAAALRVDLAKVKGTGPAGAVTREDVERAADKSARMRQAISAAISRSKREIPHYYVSTTVDMHDALEWLTGQNAKRPVEERLVYGVLLVKAVALALRRYPEFNAVWKDDQVVRSPAVHVGMAISLRQGGLVAPALHDADKLSLPELMRALSDLVERARSGALRSSEFSDPTITVTSLGDRGVESLYPIIYPPQVAIVGFGKLVERPWVVDQAVVPRPLITASLSGDHRVTDAHRGALFLVAIERLLQEPAKL